MSRIHEYPVVYKTLFYLDTFKPGSLAWNPDANQLAAMNSLRIYVHDIDIFHCALSSENGWPDYVVRTFISKGEGYANIQESESYEAETNIDFNGATIMLELNPMFDRTAVYYDIHQRLCDAAVDYERQHLLRVDFDEAYSWRGAHLHNLMSEKYKAGAVKEKLGIR